MGDPAVSTPTLGHQRRVLVGAGEAQRRQIDVQAPGINTEALDRPCRQQAAHGLRRDREGLQRAAKTIVV
jgi:hypothetical protein